MSAKVYGLHEAHLALDALLPSLQKRVEDTLAMHAERVRARVVVDINTQTPNPGYTVPEGATGRAAHIPSPPGEPPNADTGRLSNSYTTDGPTRQGLRFSSRVVAGTVYAMWLEFGTPKMAARPHLLPRFNEAGPKFQADMRAALKASTDDVKRKSNIRPKR